MIGIDGTLVRVGRCAFTRFQRNRRKLSIGLIVFSLAKGSTRFGSRSSFKLNESKRGSGAAAERFPSTRVKRFDVEE